MEIQLINGSTKNKHFYFLHHFLRIFKKMKQTAVENATSITTYEDYSIGDNYPVFLIGAALK